MCSIFLCEVKGRVAQAAEEMDRRWW
uniref:Uncharacterized protein n=1 Tax=Zea mays TaxID=4577 RepID=C4J5Q0_MAIZE|nr:unknown [Zea mays]